MDFTKRSADLIRKFHPLGRRWWTGVLFQGIKQHVTHKMCLKHTYFYQNLVSNNDCFTTILPTHLIAFGIFVIRMLALLWSIFPVHASLFPCFLSLCNCVYTSSRPNICNCVQAFYLPCNCVQAWSLALQFPAHQSWQRFQVPWLNCKTTATAAAVTTSSLKQKSQKLNWYEWEVRIIFTEIDIPGFHLMPFAVCSL